MRVVLGHSRKCLEFDNEVKGKEVKIYSSDVYKFILNVVT